MPGISVRAQEKQRLIAQRDALRLKYPPGVYGTLGEEPEDVLRHCRECIRFDARSHAELEEIRFTGV